MPPKKSKSSAELLNELMPLPEAVPTQKSIPPKRPKKKVSIVEPAQSSAKLNDDTDKVRSQARQEIRELFNTTLMFEEESDESEDEREQTPPPPVITKNKDMPPKVEKKTRKKAVEALPENEPEIVKPKAKTPRKPRKPKEVKAEPIVKELTPIEPPRQISIAEKVRMLNTFTINI